MKIIIPVFQFLLRFSALVVLLVLISLAVFPTARPLFNGVFLVYVLPATIIVILKRTVLFLIKKPRA